MTLFSAKDTLILAEDLRSEVLGERVGELILRSGENRPPAPFKVLDFFDRSIRKSDRLLIETGNRLVLIHDAAMIVQEAGRNGNFVADLMVGPVKDALGGLSPLRCLLTVGEGMLDRRQLSLTDDEGKTQARAELIGIRPKGGGKGATLALLQDLRGYDEALAALRMHLRAFALPGVGRIVDLPDLLFSGLVPYSAKPEIAISEDQSAFAAANAIISTYLTVARRNEAGIIADHDSEFLHDYRIALRKIRSVISLFKGVYSAQQCATLKGAISGLMAPTGRLRDLDVYLLAREQYASMLPATLHEGFELLFHRFEQERRREHKRLIKSLKSPAHQTAFVEIESLFASAAGPEEGVKGERPALDYARAQIWKRYSIICKTGAAIDSDTPDEDIHRLRINCKKLRYLMEFFAPIFPANPFRTVLKPLKDLQDSLGRLNDFSMQQASLLRFMENHGPMGRHRDLLLAQSVGGLIAALHGQYVAERLSVISDFAQFDSAVVRRNYRVLFRRDGT